MEFTIVDWVLLGGMALLAVIGLFRGISGELGSLLGLAAGVLAGFLLYGVAQSLAVSMGFEARGAGMLKGATIVVDCVMALIIGGTVRILVRKFVSFLMGRMIDSMLGLLSGVLKGALLIGVVTGFGLVTVGDDAEGPLASHSPVVEFIASLANSYAAGTEK